MTQDQSATINDLTVISSSDQIASFTSRIDAERLVKIFLSNKSERTIAAYRKTWQTLPDSWESRTAISITLPDCFSQMEEEEPTLSLPSTREQMESRKLSPATINRRLSALRSMVEQAGTWACELGIENQRSEESLVS